MIAVLLLLLALAVGVGAVVLAHVDAGYVLINYGPWVMETTLLVLVLGVVLWFLLIYAAVKLLTALLQLPGGLRGRLGRRRERRSRLTFEAGLLHLLEGRWKRAETELLRHAADRPSPHLNYLAAARAAQRLGADERRDHYLQLASDSAHTGGKKADSGRIAALITHAEMQRERGEYTAMKATAEQLHTLDAGNPYSIELLAEALVALGEWAPLHTLLYEESAYELDPDLRHGFQQRALSAQLQEAVVQGSLDRLKALWKDAGELQSDNTLRLSYARGLARLGADAEAMALVTQVLNQDWNADFAKLYSQLHAADPLATLASIEQWLQRYGERPELLSAAGHACLENHMWGKAQSYLDAVLRVAPTAQAHLDLAHLAEQTQRPDDAARHYREGLALATQTAGR